MADPSGPGTLANLTPQSLNVAHFLDPNFDPEECISVLRRYVSAVASYLSMYLSAPLPTR